MLSPPWSPPPSMGKGVTASGLWSFSSGCRESPAFQGLTAGAVGSQEGVNWQSLAVNLWGRTFHSQMSPKAATRTLAWRILKCSGCGQWVPWGSFAIMLWPLQVQMFLKDSWISGLKVAMRSSLRDMSKGWYNLYETNWEVYLMSKLRKLMEMIKYMLQDALRFLVQDSLTSFTQFISDACGSVLDCPEDMVWGEDLMNSPYR